jgi:2-polyprenyl-6-methoxyphenol hydroxylase-like FAD-dependent oxidoreductase
LLDRLTATDTPPQHAMTFDAGPIVLTGRPAPAPDGSYVGYGPRRFILDPLLAAAAIEAVATFWVVGADGKHSGIAAVIGAKAYLARPATTCVYYTFFQDFDPPHTRIFVREGQFAVALPTNGGLTNLAIMWPASEFARVRGDIEAAFNAAAAQIPWIAARITRAKRVERFVGR